MTLVKSALVAGGVTLALAVGALAQGNDPWDLKERTAYMVMMDGSTKVTKIGDKGFTMLMKDAKLVPHGTVFVMDKGKLYMVDASSMFDKAGMPSFGGGF